MSLKEELAQLELDLKRLEERKRELYKRSIDAPSHEKICENYLAALLAEPPPFPEISYPIAVTGIEFTGRPINEDGYRMRGLVRVRPCGAEFEKKTFLGLYLGDIARTMGCSHNPESGVLEVYLAAHNPAIWIPSRSQIVFGCESWWGPLETEEQLRDITDETIDGIWYVQAMKTLMARGKSDVQG